MSLDTPAVPTQAFRCHHWLRSELPDGGDSDVIPHSYWGEDIASAEVGRKRLADGLWENASNDVLIPRFCLQLGAMGVY